MSFIDIDYTKTHRPYSRVWLWLDDFFKYGVIIITFSLVAGFIVMMINNYIYLRYLNSHDIISSRSVPVWLAVVPELSILIGAILVGLVTFYFYNHMAYSGYKISIMIIAVMGAGISAGLLMFLINTFPEIRLSFRNLESLVQTPLPSQGYMSSIKEECQEKGYFMGWVEDYSTDSVTVNRWGERETFEFEATQRPAIGQNVLVATDCDEIIGCRTRLISVN